MATVAIVYGFAEGTWQGRYFEAALRQAGYTIIKDTARADIIVAHSAGSYVVPASTRAKYVMHVGLALYPERRLMTSMQLKVSNELRWYQQQKHFSGWLMKCAMNGLYILRPRYDWKLWRGFRQQEHFLQKLPNGQHIFIVNQFDEYCSPAALLTYAPPGDSFMSLAGHHDDIWRNPETYIAIMKHYERLLV